MEKIMETWMKSLSEQDIVVVSSAEKETLLNLLSKSAFLPKFKLYTFLDFKNLISYENTLELAFELSKRYPMSLDLANIYLNNLYYIQKDTFYQSKRLQDLQNTKNKFQNLFEISSTHLHFLKDKNIYVYHGTSFKKEMIALCQSIHKTCTFIEDTKVIKNILFPVYRFESLEKELDYVAYSIASLIEKGISISNIKLCLPSKDFYFSCDRIFKMYQLPLQNLFIPLLKDVPFFNQFLKLLDEHEHLDEILEQLKEAYHPNSYAHLYQTLYDTINALPYQNIQDLRILAPYYFKNHSFYDGSIKNAIEVIDYHQYVDENDYIFIVGMNQSIIPQSFKDEDYLSDKEKEILQISTSLDKNNEDKEAFIHFLNTHTHVFLSFHDKANNQTTYPSFLIKELKLEIKTIEKDYAMTYCKLQDALDLARFYDISHHTGKIYDILNQNYNIEYNQYNNQFKTVSASFKKEIANLNLELSYSSLNTFYQCPFHYYLSYILRLDSNQNTFIMDVGSLFHYILSKQYETDFDFETLYQHYFDNKKILSAKEKFYLQKLKTELLDLMDYNCRMLQHSKLKTILCEQKFKIQKSNKIHLNVIGYIDKIMAFEENNQSYVAVIDFKTGNPEFDINKLDFGLSMQLPVYLYLIHHSDLFKNVIVLGLYLQKIVNAKPKAYSNATKEDKDKVFKLQGYSLKDQGLISLLDDSYTNSLMINGLRTKTDGSFYAKCKVLDKHKMEETLQKVEEKLSEAANLILNGDFKVQPKMINNLNESCTYCEHANVCYVRANNMVYKTTAELHKAKGGDDNE